MTNRMPCNISDGPEFEESTEQPSPEFERDISLVDALKDITLSQQIDRIEGVIADLSKTVYAKRQAE